jgi:hypothetical protein
MARRAPFRFEPFAQVLGAAASGDVRSFQEVEADVLVALAHFDNMMALGELTSGQYQAKGLFFNELVAILIERCAQQRVARRGKRPGILLASVDVDICFPSEPRTRPEVIAETKMAGTPKHPGNPQAGPLGRAGSADLGKRIREIALNVIDLKLADAEGATAPIHDISTWIQQTTPPFFAFFGIRTTGERDLSQTVGRAQLLANSYANGVGLFLYEPVDPSTETGLVTYRPLRAPGGMSIDDTVTRICRLIKSVASQPHRTALDSPTAALPESELRD